MTVRVRQQHGGSGVGAPLVTDKPGPDGEKDQDGKGPDKLEDGDEGALVEFSGKPGYAEEGEDVDHGVRDGEKIGVEGAEADGAEGEG